MTTVNDVAIAPDTAPHGGFVLWRHHHPSVRALTDARLGHRALGGDAADEARRAYELGVRFVTVEPVADLGPDGDPEQTVAVLSLVRELTSHGMEVDWRARLAPDGPAWWVFGHLFPPAAVEGPGGDEALLAWRTKYHIGRCFMRRGPGFVQIRDRRHAGFRRLTIADSAYLTAIDALLAGRDTDAVPEPIVSAFEQQHLAVRFGDRIWWAPYRLQRWPLPSWEV
ncbi:DUF5825 family protein [Kitasatospora sp. NPDC058965]|uniref:DUF5825 family protein n=1 Tax=Kitasatospora sp. NPDC058965 TaxID=3346682 RepID=UPI0036C1EB0F